MNMVFINREILDENSLHSRQLVGCDLLGYFERDRIAHSKSSTERLGNKRMPRETKQTSLNEQSCNTRLGRESQ